MIDTEMALKIMSVQIFDDLLGNPGAISRISCALITEWTISHDSGAISIIGPTEFPTGPSLPPWMEYEIEDGKFIITTAVEPYLNDFIGLILEAWRVDQDNRSYSSEESLRDAIERIANRWNRQKDPLGELKQKELIGELTCVLDSYRIRGTEAVDSWDPTGRQLYDLDSESWVIESKATSSDPESVTLSKPEQVDFRIKKTLILGVTSLNKNSKEGETFPQIMSKILSEFNATDRHTLNLKLINRGYTPSSELDEKYSTNWKIHGTRYLLITEQSKVLPCAWIDDRPDTILQLRQRLVTVGFPNSELTDLIGG